MKAQNIILILEDGRKIIATCPECGNTTINGMCSRCGWDKNKEERRARQIITPETGALR